MSTADYSPLLRLTELISADAEIVSAHVIGFGEIHDQAIAMRRLGRALMPVLAGHGFLTLAVEIVDDHMAQFSDFNDRTGKDQALASAIAKDYDNYAMRGKDPNSSNQIEADYFQMLLAARDVGIKVIPVDIRQGYLRSDITREPHIYSKVSALLHSNNRVIYWGGPRHLHKRTDIDTKFKSLAELLTEDRYTVFSVAQMVDGDRYINRDPILAKLASTPYIRTKDLNRIADNQALGKTMVTNGKLGNEDDKESLAIQYKHWDALIKTPDH